MTDERRTTSGVAAKTRGVIAIALGIALVAPDARSQGKPNPMTPGLPPTPQLNACTQLLQAGGVKVDVTATATGPTTVELTWQGPPGDYEVKSSTGGFQAAVSLAQPRVLTKRGDPPALAQGAATHASAQADAVNSYALTATLKDGRKACGAGSVKTPPMPVVAFQPKGPLTPKQFPLAGWVDLHTHPMSNLAFAGRLSLCRSRAPDRSRLRVTLRATLSLSTLRRSTVSFRSGTDGTRARRTRIPTKDARLGHEHRMRLSMPQYVSRYSHVV